MIGKREVFRRFQKTDSVEAEVTSGGRLFQRRHSEMHDHQQWTAVYVGSLAARMTTIGDGDGWKRRRSGCSQKDTVAPGHAGIDR